MQKRSRLLLIVRACLALVGLACFPSCSGNRPEPGVEHRVAMLGNVHELNYQLEYTLGNKYGADHEAFLRPHVTLGHNGELYVSDIGNNRILHFDASGKFIGSVGRAGQGPGDFIFPYCITTGNDHSIYVLETVNKRVQCFDENLRLLRLIKPTEFYGAYFIVNSKSELYLRSNTPGELFSVFNGDGEKISSIPVVPSASGNPAEKPLRFDYAFDESDNLCVASLWPDSCCLDYYELGSNHVTRTRLPLPEFSDTPSERPQNVALIFGHNSYLYLLLIPSNTIYKLNRTGEVLGRITLGIPNQVTSASFESLAVDRNGNVYITDIANKLLKYHLFESS